MRLVNVSIWNTEWASPTSRRGKRIKEKLVSLDADILCVTEGSKALLPETGWIIESEPDYGYPLKPGRRKVLLWSRNKWTSIDQIGEPSLPPGRFVCGTTETRIGALAVIGVCIPWKDAHVRT